MATVAQFFYEQLFFKPPYPGKDLKGQTIIVTGSNVGLGLEAARHLTRLGAEKVILAVRNLGNGEAARKSIEKTTGRIGVVEVWQLDLASYDSVKAFAKRAEGLNRVDSIIQNAGISTRTYRTMEDNESTITTNVVSTYLLSLLILPKLRETVQTYNVRPYLTIVSSEVHAWINFYEWKEDDIFQVLNDKEKANMADRYQLSKLLEVLYTREMAKRAKPQVIMNLVNPGLCHSALTRESPWALEILKFFLARSTEVGSRTLVHAGTEAGAESHGKYLSSCEIVGPSPFVISADGANAQERFWDQLSKKLETIQPGIMQNV